MPGGRDSVSTAVSRWVVGLERLETGKKGEDEETPGLKEEGVTKKNEPLPAPVLTCIWVVVTITAAIYVLIDHPEHRLRFFTNWSMCAHAFIATLLLGLHYRRTRYVHTGTGPLHHIMDQWFEPHVGPWFLSLDWATSWVVLLGSRFIIADANVWAAAKLQADPWLMVWGDFVYHVLPPVMSIGLIWDHPRIVERIANFSWVKKASISAIPVIFMLIYRAVFDVKDVYMLHSRGDAFGLDGISAATVFVAAFCFWFIPMKPKCPPAAS